MLLLLICVACGIWQRDRNILKLRKWQLVRKNNIYSKTDNEAKQQQQQIEQPEK